MTNFEAFIAELTKIIENIVKEIMKLLGINKDEGTTDAQG